MRGNGTRSTGRWARSLDVGELAVIREEMSGDKPILELSNKLFLYEFTGVVYTIEVTFRLVFFFLYDTAAVLLVV